MMVGAVRRRVSRDPGCDSGYCKRMDMKGSMM